MVRVYKHTSAVGLGAEVNPKMLRPKVLSAGKGHVAYLNESGPTMMELYRVLKQGFDKMNRRVDRRNDGDLKKKQNAPRPSDFCSGKTSVFL